MAVLLFLAVAFLVSYLLYKTSGWFAKRELRDIQQRINQRRDPAIVRKERHR